MKKGFNKREGQNKSKSNLSSGLLKTLKDLHTNGGGTVTYVFLEERIDFSDPKFPRGKYVNNKYSISSNINSEILYDDFRGKLVRRSPQEILNVFESTKHDLGASYYIIN